MQVQGNFSRRAFLKSISAVGCVAAAGHAFAQGKQGAQRIERMDPALDRILKVDQPIRELGSGYGGWGRPKARCGGRKVVTCCSAISTTTAA